MTSYGRGYDVMRVGALTLLALVAFGGLFAFATNRALTRSHSDLFLSFPSAEGLKKGDAVLFHGVQVGEVRRLAFERGGVLVHARVTESFELREDARAALAAADIFGRQSVVLRQGTALGTVQDGDTLAGSPPGSLTARLEDLGVRAGRMLGDTTVAMLHGALTGIGGATAEIGSLATIAEATLAEQRTALGQATWNVAHLTARLDSVVDADDLERIRSGVAASVTELAHAAARADTATAVLNRILAQVEHGNGSAARMLNDPALYETAAAALESLDALLRDLRQNPKRYVNISVF
jgi:phospholipid/cholesterol/gamma-HCH transport system substrate-binding protein